MNFSVFFVICFPIIVHSCSFEIFKGSNICDDGEEIWTVGYGNRSLEAVVAFKNCSASRLKDEFIWCSGVPCVGIATNGLSNDENLFASWKSQNDTHLASKLEIYSTVNGSVRHLLYSMRTTSGIGPLRPWNIFIKYCPEENGNGVAIMDLGGNSTYGSRGTFSCPEGHYLVDIAGKQLATNTTTVCGTCARWDRMERMDCWKVPNVIVNGSFTNKVFTVGDQLTSEICHVIDHGKPKASIGLFHNNFEISTPFTLQPQHNNMTLYCKAKNELTNLLKSGGNVNEPFMVEIEFGPTSYSEWTSCTSNAKSDLYNVTLHVSLSANPPVGKPSIFVDDKKQIVLLKLSNGSVGCCGVLVQNYEISLIKVTKESKVTVEFNHKIQKLTLIYNSVTGNCSIQQQQQPIEIGNMSETTIAVICSGVVIVLILITGYVTLYFKKSLSGSAQADNKEAGTLYEIPIAHAYEYTKNEKNGRGHQNMESTSNTCYNEETAYAL